MKPPILSSSDTGDVPDARRVETKQFLRFEVTLLLVQNDTIFVRKCSIRPRIEFLELWKTTNFVSLAGVISRVPNGEILTRLLVSFPSVSQ